MTRALSPWTHRFPRLGDFEREFPRWMSEVFGPETSLRDFEFLPEANVSETDKSIDVSIDLPGMKPEDVKVELHDRVLTISGERKEEKE
jgi:HSP20 family protein